MCSPELTKGLCQICTGTLTTDNTQVDRLGNTWDVHKGVCAIEAGCIEAVPAYYRGTYFWYLGRIKSASTSEVRRLVVRKFTRWIRGMADENHYYTALELTEEDA